jgi:hypothetical protein
VLSFGTFAGSAFLVGLVVKPRELFGVKPVIVILESVVGWERDGVSYDEDVGDEKVLE